MTSAELLGHIQKQPHGRTSLKTLFRDLRIRGEQRNAIETALDKLVARGELLETARRPLRGAGRQQRSGAAAASACIATASDS